MRAASLPGSVVAAALLLAAAPLAAAPGEKPRRPDIELFTVETRIFPALDMDDPTPGTFEESARIRPFGLRLRANLPWRHKTDRSSFSVGLNYERLDLELDGWPASEPFPRGPFHSVQLPMSYARTFRDERWGARFFLTPGISSDFHGTPGRGFRAQGGALLERRQGGGAWSFGLVLINDYGVPRVFPAVAWRGRIAERQTLVVRLPVQLSWAYELSDACEWGVAARVSGGNYEIGRTEVFREKQLKHSAGTVGPYVRRRFGRWTVGVEAGLVFLHSLEVRDHCHQVRDFDLERSAFVSTAVRLSL